MNTEWLAARNFERAHEIIAAINTLSIHAKRSLAREPESVRASEIDESRKVLLAFLERFASIVRQAEGDRDSAIIGADPRLSLLAKKFMVGRRQWPQRSLFYAGSLEEFRDLLTSERSEDQPRLISSLRDLRTLIEQHAHADVIGILGEI